MAKGAGLNAVSIVTEETVMASLLQRIGTTLGLGNSEPLVSGNSLEPGSANVAFHLDVHQPGTTGQQLLVAEPQGATLIAPDDERALMIGGAGNDRLIGGGHSDLLIGGGGTNVMTGGGGTDVFGHAAGATDVVTDFSPSAGEHIALQTGLSLTGSTHAIVDPANFGLSGGPTAAVLLDFSDSSQVVLLHSTDTPNPGWFI